MKKIILLSLLFSMIAIANGWDGVDQDSGNDVEVTSGNLVREGESIDFYDSGTGEEHSGDVQSITRYGSTVEIEIYDNDTGEYRILEMDD